MRFRYAIGQFSHPNTVWLVPCPYIGRGAHKEAYKVSHRLKKIANKIFMGDENKGGQAANEIYTARGIGVLFQHRDREVNMKRAKEVTKEYRKQYGTFRKKATKNKEQLA